MIKFIKGHFKNSDPNIKDWDEPTIREFNGKKVVGRPTKGYGSSTFTYAGKTYEPTPWTTPMYKIRLGVEALINKECTFCLCGYYGEDGKGLPHHSDTVPTLDDLVVSISFGGPRVFQWREYHYDIKEKTDTSEVKFDCYYSTPPATNYILEHGDVIIFDGHSQMRSTHAVLPMEHATERINLTFRTGI